MEGITRINITDSTNGRGGWRFEVSRKMRPAANELYRAIWKNCGISLLPGDALKDCALGEFAAGYDSALGIDVIFAFNNGASATLQEKFLTTTFYTLTVEYMQAWRKGIKGDWFNMKCQYYFVGYFDMKDKSKFTKWTMVNWPVLQLAPNVQWRERRNEKDGARSSFRYVPFEEIPSNCIVASGCIL